MCGSLCDDADAGDADIVASVKSELLQAHLLSKN